LDVVTTVTHHQHLYCYQ